MAQPQDPRSNRLLAALTDADWQRWRPQLECVDLKRGQILYEPGQPQRHAYFPTGAVVSLMSTLASGASTEVAVVGDEGIVGMSLVLGAGSTTSGGAVLIAGQGFRIGALAIQHEFRCHDTVRRVLLHYIQALATQISQTAICNRHHTVEQQLCGLLLQVLDRLRSGEVAVTQECIAGLLGVRRESVTAAAGHLQQAGLIRYARGHIEVRNRLGLEQHACACHAIVKQECDRLLPREPVDRSADPGRRGWPGRREAAQGQLRPTGEVEAISGP
jgi:CRP-like cAMP-binding protein